MKKKKKMLIVFLVILFCFLFFFYLIIVNRKVQEERLYHDVNQLAQENLLSNYVFPSSTVLGTYQEVETEIEKYLGSFYQQYQMVLSYTKDKKLLSLLSVDNYLSDGVLFEDSLTYVEEVRKKFQVDMEELLELLTEEKVEEFSRKLDLSKYYQQLVIFHLESSVLLKLESYEKVFLAIENQMNEVFNTIINTLNFLKSNSNDWIIEDQEIQFSTEALFNQYNSLVSSVS